MYINPKTIKNIRDPRTGKYYSEADLQAWTTGLTKIKVNQGKNKEIKATKALRKNKRYANKKTKANYKNESIG